MPNIQKEIWVDYIIQRYFKDNAFLNKAYNDDKYVLAGKVVHIPTQGAVPTVVKNRTSFPTGIVRRADTDLTYLLDEYSSDSTHIVDADKVQLSYDKITDVFGDHAGVISENAADDMLIKWLTGISAGSIINTSGSAAAATLAGQTGTRKVLLHNDLRRAKLAMDLQNIPAQDRYALLESNMADQLFESLSNSQYKDFSQYADAKEGIIGRLYGFDIMERSKVCVASSANAINPLGASTLGTDNAVSMVWQKSAVARALGTVKFFEDKDRADYQGDIYSALLRAGGRRRRADDSGVIAIVAGA